MVDGLMMVDDEVVDDVVVVIVVVVVVCINYCCCYSDEKRKKIDRQLTWTRGRNTRDRRKVKGETFLCSLTPRHAWYLACSSKIYACGSTGYTGK